MKCEFKKFFMCIAVLALTLHSHSATASYTSVYKQMYLRGSNNAWGSTAMTLVANNTWSASATFAAGGAFKFDVNGDWSVNFGASSTAGIAAQSGGNITVSAAGTDTITFNDSSKAYTVSTGSPVHVPPVANAGSNQAITSLLPASVTLNGSASTDSDGTIVSYAWAELINGVATPLATVVSPTLSQVSVGVHTYQLTVNDNQGATGTAQVTVTITAPHPVANAGANQTISSTAPVAVVLNGSASTDPGATSISYAWAELVNGVANPVATVMNPTLANVSLGIHTYRLTITDNFGASATAQVTVTIAAAGYSSVYKQMFLRGSNNAWGSTAMTLVANNTWSVNATFAAGGTLKFDVNGDWSINFGSGSSAGIAVAGGGNIVVAGGAGSYAVTFNDSSKAYTLTPTSSAPPTVNLIAPLAGAKYAAPASVTLTASASGNGGSIASVAFYNGSALLAAVSNSPYTYTWAGVPVGSYSLTAKATNTQGAATTSTPVLISVVADTAPTVAISAPSSGTVVNAPATFVLTATAASATSSISQVQFYNGSTLLGAATSSSPYSYTWANVAAGSYQVTAKAYDALGVTASSSPITLIANAPPTVSLSAPAPNTAYAAPASITLTATAADSDGSIANVAFYNGPTLLSTVTVSPYAYTWANVAVGSYNLTAKATDNRGAVTTSTVVQVSVVTAKAPTVSITAPVTGTIVTAPASFVLTATAASTASSISKVEFYNGSILLSVVTASPFTFTWANVATGTYSVTAKAYDKLGLSTVSSAVTMIANAPPTVSLTTPTANTVFYAPASILLTATAADSDGSITKVAFYNGNTLLGSTSVSPYTYTWTNVAVGSYQLSAIATDNRGATTTSTIIPVTVSTSNGALTVKLTAPTSGAVLTLPSITLSATASETGGSIQFVEFFSGGSYGDGGTSLGTASGSPYTYVWTPSGTGTYTISATAFDTKGGYTSTPPVTVTVVAPSPGVTINSPQNGANYAGPTNLIIAIGATQPGGAISEIDLYSGTTQLTALSGFSGDTSNVTTAYSWLNVAPGTYTLTAKVHGTGSTIVTSAPVTFTVTACFQ